MPDNEITPGELSRGLTALEARINAQFSEIKHQLSETNRRFDSLQFVHREAYEVQTGQINRRLDNLEGDKKWMARTLVVSLLLPLVVAGVIAAMVSL